MEESLFDAFLRKGRERPERIEFWKTVLSMTAPGSTYTVSTLLAGMLFCGWPEGDLRDELARAGIEHSPTGGRWGSIAISIESIGYLLRETVWAAKSPLQMRSLIEDSINDSTCRVDFIRDEHSPVIIIPPRFFEVLDTGHATVRRYSTHQV
jgi:hypothetical protein